MKRHIINFIVVLVGIISLAACNENVAYDHYRSVDVDGWDRDDTLDFVVGKIPAGNYNLCVGFRATSEYPYKELGLDVSYTTSANGKATHKRIKCNIFDQDGRLMGKNGISSNDFLYNVSNIKVNKGDSIVVSISHSMNQDLMPGLTQVGLQLQPIE